MMVVALCRRVFSVASITVSRHRPAARNRSVRAAGGRPGRTGGWNWAAYWARIPASRRRRPAGVCGNWSRRLLGCVFTSSVALETSTPTKQAAGAARGAGAPGEQRGMGSTWSATAGGCGEWHAGTRPCGCELATRGTWRDGAADCTRWRRGSGGGTATVVHASGLARRAMAFATFRPPVPWILPSPEGERGAIIHDAAADVARGASRGRARGPSRAVQPAARLVGPAAQLNSGVRQQRCRYTGGNVTSSRGGPRGAT